MEDQLRPTQQQLQEIVKTHALLSQKLVALSWVSGAWFEILQQLATEAKVLEDKLKQKTYHESCLVVDEKVEALLEALKEIADIPPVPYKIDRLEHCSLTVEEMQRIAQEAIRKAKSS